MFKAAGCFREISVFHKDEHFSTDLNREDRFLKSCGWDWEKHHILLSELTVHHIHNSNRLHTWQPHPCGCIYHTTPPKKTLSLHAKLFEDSSPAWRLWMSSPSWQKAKFKWKKKQQRSQQVDLYRCVQGKATENWLHIWLLQNLSTDSRFTVSLLWMVASHSVGETPVTSTPHTPYLPKKPRGTEPMKKHCVFLMENQRGTVKDSQAT